MRIIGFGHDKQTDQGHLSEGKNIPLFLPQWGQVLERGYKKKKSRAKI